MPNLPPPVWAELFYSGAWNTITDDVRVTTSAVTITRGLTSESSSEAEPTSCTCDLDSRDHKYAPRNPTSTLYNLIGRNTPMRLGYTAGSPWAQMTGAAGNKLTTPDSAALAVTDLDLRVDIALEDWSQGQKIAGRYSTSGENRSWALVMAGTGQVGFYWSPDGTLASRIIQFSTIPVVAYNGQRLALRVTLDVNNGAGGYELRFYTGRTVNDTEWHLVGDPITGGATTAVFDGAAGIELGDIANLVDNTMNGKLFAFKLLNGIAGTVVVSMAVAAGTPGGTSFTGSTGETWTVQGGAVLTNKHIRMSGEVPAWPPTRDLSGNDNYVSVTPTGVTRRMDAGNKPQDSALLRFLKASTPLACWPLTDSQATSEGMPLSGRQSMNVSLPLSLGTDPPEWGSGTLADWMEPVITFKGETGGVITGGMANSTSAAAAWSVDFLFRSEAPGNAGVFEMRDRGAGTDADNQVYFQLSLDTVDNDITIFRVSRGDTSSSSSLLTSVTNVGIYDGAMHHIRFSVDPGATDSVWTIYVDGVQKATGTLTGIVVKALHHLTYSWSLVSGGGISGGDQQLGYVTYWDGTGPTAAAFWDAATGFQGELAGNRILRLATAAGYTASVAGEAEYQRPMGIQGQKKLLELLNEASRTNFGYLLDARDRAEVIHRGQSTLWNQTPALTLDFSAGLISPPFKPVDDDKLTENDVSVKREYGSVPAREVLEEGELSVLAPEDGGVGRYDTAYTYSLETDAQARQVAAMKVHLGTYAGVRYARITLNLANSRVYALIDDILRVDVGDKIRLTDLPADHGPDDVDVLVVGYTEEAGPDAWLITFNCVPGEPWTAGVVGSGHVDTDGSELASAVDTDDTLLSVAGPLWTPDPTDTPVDVRVGGEVMTVTTVGRVLNSNPFFQGGISGWAAQNSTISHSTAQVHPDAVASMLITPNGVAAFGGATTSTGAASITPAAQYVASMWVYSAAGIDQVQPLVDWFNNVGGYISSSTTPGGFTIPAAEWTHIQATYTAPAGASEAILSVRHEGTPAASETYYVWAVRLVPVSSYSASPQTFTVVRSINGVQKAHPSGQDVRLAHPVYVAM